MRRFACLGALLFVGVVAFGASTASAAVTYITAPPAGTWVSLTRCITQGSITLSQGQYIRAGWGTVSQQQALDFLDAQNLTLTATGTGSTTGTYALGWPSGSGTWTQPAQVSDPNSTVNNGKPFWQTLGFVQVNIPVGTYSLSTAGTTVNRAVFDGQSVVKKGQNWFSIPACTLTVAAP